MATASNQEEPSQWNKQTKEATAKQKRKAQDLSPNNTTNNDNKKARRTMGPKKKIAELEPWNIEENTDEDLPQKNDDKLELLIRMTMRTQQQINAQAGKYEKMEERVKNNSENIQVLTDKLNAIQEGSSHTKKIIQDIARAEKNIVIRSKTLLNTDEFNHMLSEKNIRTKVVDCFAVGDKTKDLKTHIGKCDTEATRNKMLSEIGNKLSPACTVGRDIPIAFKVFFREMNAEARAIRKVHTDQSTKRCAIRTQIIFDGPFIVLQAKHNTPGAQFFTLRKETPPQQQQENNFPEAGPLNKGEREVLSRTIILSGNITRKDVIDNFSKLTKQEQTSLGITHVEPGTEVTKVIFNTATQAEKSCRAVNNQKYGENQTFQAVYLNLLQRQEETNMETS